MADQYGRTPPTRPAGSYYDREKAAGKKRNAAIIYLARRRVDVLHAMLRNHTPTRTGHPHSPLDETHRDTPLGGPLIGPAAGRWGAATTRHVIDHGFTGQPYIPAMAT